MDMCRYNPIFDIVDIVVFLDYILPFALDTDRRWFSPSRGKEQASDSDTYQLKLLERTFRQ
jgi:hypothetical protein